MMRRAVVFGIALFLVACSSTPAAAVRTSPSPSASASPSLAATPVASPTPSLMPSVTPSPTPVVQALISCRSGISPSAMFMLGHWPGPYLIYDVSNPVHPTLVCSIENTTAHLFTGDTFMYMQPVSATETDLVLHSIGSGHESVQARLPFGDPYVAWTPDGGTLAYSVDMPDGTTQVWLYAQGRTKLVYTYARGIGDCPCRFGLPPPQLALSPDAQYVVAGWPVGKGSVPIAVYRVADGARVLTADSSVYQTLWGRTGHRLYMSGTDVKAWTPEAGLVAVTAIPWGIDPGLSPDGFQAAYTAYADQAQTQVRVYVFDLQAKGPRMLTNAMRSQVLFVKDGWVWYLQEIACGPNDGCPGTSRPGTAVYAMNLATSVEQQVTFASGDAPLDRAGDMGSFAFQAGEFWPNS